MSGFYIYSDVPALAGELVGFAKSAGKEATVIAFTQDAADALAASGADTVCVVEGAAEPVENYAKALAAYLKQEEAELFLVGATTTGRDLAARVAGYCDCAMMSDVSSLAYDAGTTSAVRMVYGGMIQERESADTFAVVTVGSGKFEPVSGEARIQGIELAADSRVKLVGTSPVEKGSVDLAAADKVVCIGMGMKQREDMRIAEDLAGVMGAAIGCSRGVAEERQWLPQSQYIGISGVQVKSSLYLSMGVSGQAQHVFGVRDSKIVAAVDINKDAPIMKAADYAIVGDLYEVVPCLTQALATK